MIKRRWTTNQLARLPAKRWILYFLLVMLLSTQTVAAAEYQRTKPLNFAGGKLVVAWPNRSDNTKPLADSYKLLVHFHGSHEVVLREASLAGLKSAIAIVNFPGLSSAYSKPFILDETLFEQLLMLTACELRKGGWVDGSAVETEIVISSFSAGYGAVREVLKSPTHVGRIGGYVAADSIYASLADSAKSSATPGTNRAVNPAQMKGFLAFAQLAQAKQRFFVLTHSAQSTPYASTTETADYLIRKLGLTRSTPPENKHESTNWSPVTECREGGFQVFGYGGLDADDHMAHLRQIGRAFSRLPGLRSTTGSNVDTTDQRMLFREDASDDWYTWLLESEYDDPQNVFAVRDGQVRISGDQAGYLATKKEFENYQLSLEFRWGNRNVATRVGKARDSGVFLHATGKDGNSADGKGAFMAAIECQVMEGAVGDLMLIRGRDEGRRIPLALTANVLQEFDSDGWPFVRIAVNDHKPETQRKTLRTWGRLNRVSKQRDWVDRFGITKESKFESPSGLWNRLVIRCLGDQIIVVLNDQLVNAVSGVTPSHGKVLLQSEGSEVMFRRVQLSRCGPSR